MTSSSPTTTSQLKLDMEVRGTILLRNTVDDTVYVLQTERLEQVCVFVWECARVSLTQGCAAF